MLAIPIRYYRVRDAIASWMAMTPERFAECLGLVGWSEHELARRLGIAPRMTSRMRAGKRSISPELEVWLEMIAGAWAELSPALREAGLHIGCDRGKFTRHPLGMRPLSDGEADELEQVAEMHRSKPYPENWRANPNTGG